MLTSIWVSGSITRTVAMLKKVWNMASWVCGALGGVEPSIMGIGPVAATKKVLAKTGMTIDDFDLIVPDYKTDITNSEGNEGSIAELMIDTAPLGNRNYASRYTYDLVYWRAFDSFTNNDCKNDVKIMMITDSFGRVVIPYLAAGFYRLDYFSDAKTVLINADLIEEYDPDIVIMLYYPEYLKEGSEAFGFRLPAK